jgi:hypothetical protein
MSVFDAFQRGYAANAAASDRLRERRLQDEELARQEQFRALAAKEFGEMGALDPVQYGQLAGIRRNEAQEGRAATEFEDTRRARAAQNAFNFARRGLQQGMDRREIARRIGPVMQQFGDEGMAAMEAFLNNPEAGADVFQLYGAQAPTTGARGSMAAPRVYRRPDGSTFVGVMEEIDGRPRLVDQATGIPVSEPNIQELGQYTASLAYDPTTRGNVRAAQSRGDVIGTEVGETQTGLGGLRQSTQRFNTAADWITDPANRSEVEKVVGVLSPGDVLSGNIPLLGPVGAAADTQARIDLLVGAQQTEAYESLRGGGHITEAEREAIAQGVAALSQAQSYEGFVEAVRSFQRDFNETLRRAEERARRGIVVDEPTTAPSRETQNDDEPVDFVFNPETGRLEPAG